MRDLDKELLPLDMIKLEEEETALLKGGINEDCSLNNGCDCNCGDCCSATKLNTPQKDTYM